MYIEEKLVSNYFLHNDWKLIMLTHSKLPRVQSNHRTWKNIYVPWIFPSNSDSCENSLTSELAVCFPGEGIKNCWKWISHWLLLPLLSQRFLRKWTKVYKGCKQMFDPDIDSCQYPGWDSRMANICVFCPCAYASSWNTCQYGLETYYSLV